ncbi:hypothetical protein Q31b_34480 [Novipirellula aureliae]|uniref:Uncharacterized protein n=1 Tax=Novipirellula aureliae TaxID=2527966 RepID=A0A5C6DV06_9BACT|nr:hypothetical protein Q31b_34480 [Novipirellula aureliae]
MDENRTTSPEGNTNRLGLRGDGATVHGSKGHTTGSGCFRLRPVSDAARLGEHTVAAERSFKTYPVSCQLVDVRRLRFGATTTQVAVAHVVDKYQNDVWAIA